MARTLKIVPVEPFMLDGARIAPASKGASKPLTVPYAVGKSLVRRGKAALASGSTSIKAARLDADGDGDES